MSPRSRSAIVDEIGVYVAHAEQLGVAWQEALDEQIFQKLLPKLKGGDRASGRPRAADRAHGNDFPLSHAKARAMHEGFVQHGFSSYF